MYSHVIIAHLAGRRMVSGNPASPRLFPVTELLKRPSATDDGRNITFDYLQLLFKFIKLNVFMPMV